MLRYQYRLEGADADWSAPSEHRTVTFASLAPGRYRFFVRAVNSDGIVSAEAAAIDFRILGPLWQRWWFVTLAALGAGPMAYAVYGYRVARLLEMADMRTRIATDLHDDIGANLTRIALLSEVRTAQGGRRTRSRSRCGPLIIARIARESVSSMSDIVWAINPARDSLLDLTRGCASTPMSSSRCATSSLRFYAPGAADSLRLGVDVRRDLLLIFKEAVNNSARHSGCSRRGHRLAHRRLAAGARAGRQRRRFRYSRSDGPGPHEHAAARAAAERHARDRIRRRRGNNRQLDVPI